MQAKVDETMDIVETGYDNGARARMRYEIGKKTKAADGLPDI